MQEVTGGFGVVMNFVSDWANPDATARSFDMIARYVMPEIQGQLEPMRESNQFVIENREVFGRAREAIIAKIKENDRAVEALSGGNTGRAPLAAHTSVEGDD